MNPPTKATAHETQTPAVDYFYVTLVKVGDRVAYADAFGAYTTVRLYPEDRLTLIPDGVTDDQAASSLLKGLTARYLLKETVQSLVARNNSLICLHGSRLHSAKNSGLRLSQTLNGWPSVNRQRRTAL